MDLNYLVILGHLPKLIIMRNLILLAAVSCIMLVGRAQQVKIFSSYSFGEGILEYSNELSGLKTSLFFFTHLDQNKKVIWKKEISMEGIPSMEAFGGLDSYIARNDSKIAYGYKGYYDKKSKVDKNRIFKVSENGTINFKEFTNQELFPFLTKDDNSPSIHSEFIYESNYCFIVSVITDKTDTQSHYLVMIDENFNRKNIKLSNSNVNYTNWTKLKESALFVISQKGKDLIYSRINKATGEFTFTISYFDLSSFSNTKEYMVTVPFDLKTDSLYYHYQNFNLRNQSSIDFTETINTTRDFSASADLNSLFSFSYSDNSVVFFGETTLKPQNYSVIDPLGDDRGAFMIEIPLDDKFVKTIEPTFYKYKEMKNSTQVFEGNETSIAKLQYNPELKCLAFQTCLKYGREDYKFKFYNLIDNQFVEIKNTTKYIIPNLYIALNQKLLTTNNKYNFEDTKEWFLLNNIDIVSVKENNVNTRVIFKRTKTNSLTSKIETFFTNFYYPN